jgi:hypothetical protein
MKTLIGYKLEIIFDNGDSNEWWRETHIESVIYPTEEMCLEAIQAIIEAWIKGIEERLKGFGVDDIEYHKSIAREYMNHPYKITPVYLYTEVTGEYKIYNVAD